MFLKQCLVALLGLAMLACTTEAAAEKKGRDGRLLSVFNIVRFPNDPCGANSNQNGTCYTEQECEDKDGTASGSCADGYGVCCVFSLGCGRTSSQNNTYFTSEGNEVGACTLEICKCDDNICQLRLDFQTFAITGPSTATETSVALPLVAQKRTRVGNCLTDTFTVTNPGGITPPQICGENSGEHMYVDANEDCNDLVFQLGQAGVGAAIAANRQWNIKVTQYSCDYNNLAPRGCTQYFFGSNTGTLRSFNNNGRHLAEQNQNFCIRREGGNCRVCYSHAALDFTLSGATADMGKANTKSCCGYGADLLKTLFDCITIPGAVKTMGITGKTADQFCGRALGSVAASGGPKTICTQRQPFNVRFLSDEYEGAADVAIAEGRLRLVFVQDNMCANPAP